MGEVRVLQLKGIIGCIFQRLRQCLAMGLEVGEPTQKELGTDLYKV